MIESLALVYTKKCNAHCRMCSADAGPSRNEKMGISEVNAYLDMAREVLGLKKLVLTGGEPLLFFDEIIQIIKHARELGLTTNVVTNAFWAENRATAISRLKTLKENGLSFISFSADKYHQEYIPITNVRQAIKAAVDINMPCSVAMVVGENDQFNIGEQVKALGEENRFYLLTDLVGLGFEKIAYHEMPPQKIGLELLPLQGYGRGSQIRDDSILRSPEEINAVTCPMVGRVVSIIPGGDIFWCCSANDQDQKINDYFKIGNLNMDSLKNMDNYLENDALCEYLAYQGPKNLLLEIMHELDKKSIRKGYTSICDICHEAFRIADKKNLYSLARKQLIMTRILRAQVHKASKDIARQVRQLLRN